MPEAVSRPELGSGVVETWVSVADGIVKAGPPAAGGRPGSLEKLRTLGAVPSIAISKNVSMKAPAAFNGE